MTRAIDGDNEASSIVGFFAKQYASLSSEQKKDKDLNFIYDTLVHPKGRTKLKKSILPELGIIGESWVRVLKPMWSFYG